MAGDRTYSTREIAQMWNVSESTVKRWADSFGLQCLRTPGGHRRFRLKDIYQFQQQRAFEATGLLSTEEWEDPNLEVWLNARNYSKVRELLVHLAAHNQRPKLRYLFERLYLRGMQLDDIYDEVVVPLDEGVLKSRDNGEVTEGQSLLVRNNLEEALTSLTQKMIRRRSNGKTALCGSPTELTRMAVSVISRILEIEGWEALNLGDSVPLRVMSEVVEIEPVNLVCVFSASSEISEDLKEGCDALKKITQGYRIPIILITANDDADTALAKALSTEECCSDFRAFRKHLNNFSH